MNLVLYGSLTSPYVRRIRALLVHTPYTMKVINIYEPGGRDILKKISPVLKIPVLQIDHEFIYDSRIIFNFLSQSGIHRKLSIIEENTLTIIDAVADSLIALFLLNKTGIDIKREMSPFGAGQFERIEMSLDFLEESLKSKSPAFNEWSYVGIALQTTLEWAIFRNLYVFKNFKHLLTFVEANKNRPGINETKPQ